MTKRLRQLAHALLLAPVLALLLAPAHALARPGEPTTLQGRVVGVTDGDTLKLLVAGNRQVVVRLASVDAPETSCHAWTAGLKDALCREAGQPFGKAAKRRLSDLVFGKTVTVQLSGSQTHGREVGVVWVDGVDANLAMVESGLACHYAQFARRQQSSETFGRYASAETNARRAQLGMWRDPHSRCAWEYRSERRAAAR